MIWRCDEGKLRDSRLSSRRARREPSLRAAMTMETPAAAPAASCGLRIADCGLDQIAGKAKV
jgi:hypothetical protein